MQNKGKPYAGWTDATGGTEASHVRERGASLEKDSKMEQEASLTERLCALVGTASRPPGEVSISLVVRTVYTAVPNLVVTGRPAPKWLRSG